jgi:hypothetical protein
VAVPASDVTTSPPGLIESSFYGFEGGYAIAEMLEPGKAYWVKTGGACRVILR